MKETKEQIEECLSRLSQTTLKTYLSFTAQMAIVNGDFYIACLSEEKKEDILAAIEQESGRMIPNEYRTLLSAQEVEILKDVLSFVSYGSYEETISKTDMQMLLAGFLSSDVLFEGICLVCYDKSEALEKYCRDCGCTASLNALREDTVFIARQAYFKTIIQYTRAAFRLYGCLRMQQLVGLILSYEPDCKERKDYVRAKESYRISVTYSPAWFGVKTLLPILFGTMCLIPWMGITLDGMLVEGHLYMKYKEEMAGSVRRAENPEGDERKDFVGDSKADPSFVRLFELADTKEAFEPENREEFLAFADGYGCKENEADKEMASYLKTMQRKALASRSLLSGKSEEEWIWEYADKLHDCAIQEDLYRNGCLGIRPESDLELARKNSFEFNAPGDEEKYLRLAARVKAGTHLWSLHGHVALNIPEPESSSVQKIKKVYPNDLCPCGSGKKYKKCCGKRAR